MPRRWLALWTAVCLLIAGLSVCSTSVAASDVAQELALSVAVGEVTGQPGEQVTVSVTFSHNVAYALTGGSVVVTYDPTALAPVAPRDEAGEVDWDLAAGEALKYAVCVGDASVSGRLTLAFTTAAYLTAPGGTLFDVTFAVLSRTAGRSPLQVTVGEDVTAIRLSDHVETALSAITVDNGAVAVAVGDDATDGILGDVDGNGKINTADARLTLQYAAGRIDAGALNLSLANVDGKGAVNTADARLILQYAAGRITRFPASDESTTPPTQEPTDVPPIEPTEPTPSEEPSQTTTSSSQATTGVTYPDFEDNTPDPNVGEINTGYGFLDPDAVPDKDQAAETNVFQAFMLCKEDNEELPYSISLYISRGYKTVTALVPSGVDLTALVPRFRYDGTVTLYGQEIRSGVDAVDFSKKFQLRLTAPDGRENTLVVKVIAIDTGLPSFTMTTEDFSKVDSKTTYKTASFTLAGGDPDVCFYANGESVAVTGQVKGRGNTSWGQEKKSYTLKFDSKCRLLDMDNSKNWVLVAAHEDYSLLRNVMGQYLGELAGVTYTLKARPVDLWYNGAYWGTYALTEKIEIEGERVDITKYTPGCGVGDAGFLLEFDGHVSEGDFEAHRNEYRLELGDGYEVYYNYTTDELFFPLSIGGKWLTISKPSYSKYLQNDPDQIRYIYDYVYKTMSVLKDDQASYADVCQYIDVESFTNWYIVEEFMNNCDSSFHSSCYMTLDVGGKLKMGPVWDFDRSSDNCNYWNAENAPDFLYTSGAAWFRYIYRHEEARAVLKQRWAAFYAATATIGETVDEWGDLLQDSADLNFRRWHVLGAEDGGSRNSRVGSNTELTLTATTYGGQVTILRDYLTNRREVMNNFITSL